MSLSVNMPSRRILICLLLVAAAPAVVMAALVYVFGVDIPYWDQWDFVPLFDKYRTGTLAWSDLFRQHNEHRLLFPRIVYIGLAALSNWNIKYEMECMVVLACLVSCCLLVVSKRTYVKETWRMLIPLFFANLLLFSPAAYETWLMGGQIALLMALAAMFVAVAIFHTDLSLWTKTVVACVAAFVTTFSFGNGLLSWFVWLPLLAWCRSREELWGRRWHLVLWAVCFGGSAFLYFHDYVSPATHPSLATVLYQPVLAVKFFLSVLGAPLAMIPGWNVKRLSAAVGLCLVVCYGLSVLYLLLRRDFALAQRLLPWLSIGGYALVTGAMITVARAGFGREAALAPRYVSMSAFLLIALIYMGVIIWDDCAARRQPASPWLRRAAVSVAGLAACALLFLHAKTFDGGMEYMKDMRTTRLQGCARLMFANVCPTAALNINLYCDASVLQERANYLCSIGWLRVRLLQNGDMSQIEATARPKGVRGNLESLTRTADGQYTVRGWAALAYPSSVGSRVADAVVISYEEEKGARGVLCLVDQCEERPDVAAALGHQRYINAGFRQSFSTQSLPPGTYTIVAWAVDGATQTASRLDHSQVLVKDAGK